jgi:hypothetical protein
MEIGGQNINNKPPAPVRIPDFPRAMSKNVIEHTIINE